MTAAEMQTGAATGGAGVAFHHPKSVRLPAQEGRNVELVLFALVMHRSLAAVLVEALGRWALGIFGYRLGSRIGLARHRPASESLRGLRRRWRSPWCGFLLLPPAAEPGRDSLKQRFALGLRMIVRQRLA